MKIVLVIDNFDSGNNGTSMTARRYAQELRKRGHTVVILTHGEPGKDRIIAEKHKIPIFQKLIESHGFCFAKPEDEAYYQAFLGADIVHFFMPFKFCRRGEDIARQMRIPTIAAFHMQPENVTYSIGLGHVKFVNEFLYWWCNHVFYNRFHSIHCPSPFIAEQLTQHGYEARLEVISNGVDRAFAPRKVEKPAAWQDKFVILMVGRLSGEKRQDLILHAVEKSKYQEKIQIVFAGKGPKEAEYRRMGNRLKNPPIFGYYGQEELITLINQCDLYIHASDAEIEGISCMEAFSCGLVPVISDSKRSATNQYALDDRSLFRAGDPENLREKIEYWIEHPEEKAQQSKRYVQLGKTLEVSQCVSRAEEMYRAAIRDYEEKGYKKPQKSRLFGWMHPGVQKANFRYCFTPLKRALSTFFTTLISPIVYAIDWLFLGFRVEGRKNLKKIRKTGGVTVMNHVHPMDCTMVKTALFPRRLYMVSLERNLELPLVGWLVRGCGGVPIPQDITRKIALQRELEQAIGEGLLIHYFPEGQLVKYHQGLRTFYRGAFLTAVRAHAPVLPMTLVYRKPKGLYKLKKKPCLCVKIGEPIWPREDVPSRVATEMLMAQATAEMERLLAEGKETEPREPDRQAYFRKTQVR